MFKSTLRCDCDSNVTPLQRFICWADIQKSQGGCMYYRNIFIEFPSLEVIMSSWCHPKSTDDQLLTVSTISRLVKSISLSSPCWVSAGVEIPAGWDDSDDGGVREGAGGHDHSPAAHSEAPVSLAASQHSTEPRVMRASRVRSEEERSTALSSAALFSPGQSPRRRPEHGA